MLTWVVWASLAAAADPCQEPLPLTIEALEATPASWEALGPVRDRVERCPDALPLSAEQVRSLHHLLARVASAEGVPALAALAEEAAAGVPEKSWATVGANTRVDGVLRPYRPVGRPVVLQRTDETGRVQQSRWMVLAESGPGAPAEWSTWVPASADTIEPEPAQDMGWRPRWGGTAEKGAGVTAEVRAGWAMGRLVNRYTALGWREEGVRRTASWDRLDGGARPVLELGVGLQLTSWLEVGVIVGLHGWQVVEQADLAEDRYDPELVERTRQTWIGGIEARSRLRPLSLGPLSPLVVVGLSARFFDASPGGWSWTPTVGPGFALQLGPHFSVLLEVPIGPWGDVEVVSGAPSAALDELRAAEPASDTVWVRAVVGLGVRL